MIKKLVQFMLSRNAEQLTEKLSDSYLMRRAAQMVVSVFYRTKALTQDQKIDNFTIVDKIRSFIERFQKNISEEMQKTKNELGKKQNR